MPYTKAITNIGLTWLANSVTSGHVIFDDIIFSDAQVNKDANSILISDFTNPISVGINKVTNNDNGFTAIGVLSNASGTTKQANIVGIIGHTDSNNTQQLIAIAFSTDNVPIFAVESSQVGNYNISFSITYSEAANVLINADNIPIANMDDVKNAVNIVIDGYNLQLTSYATNSALNSLAGSVTANSNTTSSMINSLSNSVVTNSNAISNLGNTTSSSLATLQSNINSVASSGMNPASLSVLTSSIASNSASISINASNIASLSSANVTNNKSIIANQNAINGLSSALQYTTNSLISTIYSASGYVIYDGNPFWIVQSSMMPITAQTSLTRYYSSNKLYIPGLNINKSQNITFTFDTTDNNPHYFPGLGFYQNDHGGNTSLTSFTINTSQLQNGGSYNWVSGNTSATITAPTNNTICITGVDGSASTEIINSSTPYYAVISSITIQ